MRRVCTIASRDYWITKNLDSSLRKKFLILVSDPYFSFDWSYILVPPSYSVIDLNEVISRNLKKGRVQKIEVERKTYEKFRDISDVVPKKVLPVSGPLLPVILHRGKSCISIVSSDNFSTAWAGMGRIASVSTAIHHQDRKSFLMQGELQSKILTLTIHNALREIKHHLKRYNMAGFNMILSSKTEKIVVEHLYEKLNVLRASKTSKRKDIMSTIFDAFRAFFEPKTTLSFNETIVRTNFSPNVGYWDINWKPNNDVEKKVKLGRSLNRYLRAHELFSKTMELNFESIIELMSDHGYYSGIFRNISKIYDLVLDDKVDEALKSVRKIDEKPSYHTICTHPSVTKIGASNNVTKLNFTCNLKEKEVQVVIGNPCKRRFILRFRL